MSKVRILSSAEERQRVEGLRILAGIIARHYLQHPEQYPALPNTAVEGHVEGHGGTDR